MLPRNLYVHFPFCRRKCTYCALYSRAGVSQSDRDAYVLRLADQLAQAVADEADATWFETVYFGGGTPALCDLAPLFRVLEPLRTEQTEFTVELHPLDVTDELLDGLRADGVNRISMGVQSLDDATLSAMGRGYCVDEAERTFALVKTRFDNAGIDLIVGYPGDELGPGGGRLPWDLGRLSGWGLRHCSVYSLQNERGLAGVPDDGPVLDRLRQIAKDLGAMGLERYEISNYAVPGFECRHNLAVWRGEDYAGLGDGACGRIGLVRTKSGRSETVSAAFDEKERRLFRLRTREGLDASDHPEWGRILEGHRKAGLLVREGAVYRLTERGAEVCDSILADLA